MAIDHQPSSPWSLDPLPPAARPRPLRQRPGHVQRPSAAEESGPANPLGTGAAVHGEQHHGETRGQRHVVRGWWLSGVGMYGVDGWFGQWEVANRWLVDG